MASENSGNFFVHSRKDSCDMKWKYRSPLEDPPFTQMHKAPREVRQGCLLSMKGVSVHDTRSTGGSARGIPPGFWSGHLTDLKVAPTGDSALRGCPTPCSPASPEHGHRPHRHGPRAHLQRRSPPEGSTPFRDIPYGLPPNRHAGSRGPGAPGRSHLRCPQCRHLRVKRLRARPRQLKGSPQLGHGKSARGSEPSAAAPANRASPT